MRTAVTKHYADFLQALREKVFTIKNHHVEDCGEPPKLDFNNKYLGYYENEFGEQFFFIGDYAERKAIIRGGDIGWETEVEIHLEMEASEIMFSKDELVWMAHCYSTMTRTDFEKIYQVLVEKTGMASFFKGLSKLNS